MYDLRLKMADESGAKSKYQENVRNWRGLEACINIPNHHRRGQCPGIGKGRLSRTCSHFPDVRLTRPFPFPVKYDKE